LSTIRTLGDGPWDGVYVDPKAEQAVVMTREDWMAVRKGPGDAWFAWGDAPFTRGIWAKHPQARLAQYAYDDHH
jgi:hypothetical protein